MDFKVKPYPHQLEAIELAREHKHFALLWEMGSGKTFGIINILRERYTQNQRLMRTLILSPVVTLYNWKDEILKFSKIKDYQVNVIDGSGKKRIAKLMKSLGENTDKETIIILNYEALQNDQLYDLIHQWGPEVIIADEMHYLKNHKSKRTKLAVKLADACRKRNGYVYGLTGTAILNSIADIWAQWRFLDGGAEFGRSYYQFQAIYLMDQNAAWSHQQNHFPKLVPRPESYEKVQKKVFKTATRVLKSECLPHLPPLIKTKRVVELSTEQKRLYKEMKRDFITFVDGQKDRPEAVVAQLALTKALRLQQIVSGFVQTDKGTEYEVKVNPRLKALKDLLEELTPDHKVIVWCSFKKNYEQVERVCKEIGVEYVFITGEQTTRAKRDAVKDFESNERTRVVIANRRAGGIGINLVAASYSIIYSRDFNLGSELQSEARNHRGGSERHEKIVKIDLVAKDTIDEDVLAALSAKQELGTKIIDLVKGKK